MNERRCYGLAGGSRCSSLRTSEVTPPFQSSTRRRVRMLMVLPAVPVQEDVRNGFNQQAASGLQ